MTRHDSVHQPLPIGQTIDRVVAEYGALAVLFGTLVAIFGRRAPPLTPADRLPEFLRRDVGLPPGRSRADWHRYL